MKHLLPARIGAIIVSGIALLAAAWLAGCPAQEPAAATQGPAAATQEPAAATQEPAAATQEPAAATQEPAAPGQDRATHFHARIDGRDIHLALQDCEAFLVRPDGRRQLVLDTDFYPMFSVCQRQQASLRDGHVVVELGRQALGAGGCCATEGVWRSRDGMLWERRQSGRWTRTDPQASNR